MKLRFLVCVALTLAVSQSFASEMIIKALAPLKSEYGMSISRSKVRGSNARDMLEDYATRVKGFEDEYVVSLRLSRAQLPDVDDGQDVVGLTKIVDVVHWIVEPDGGENLSKEERRRRQAQVRTLLFKVLDLGGQIGIESHSWNSCGITFPGVIILDVKAKEVISISPENTDC